MKSNGRELSEGKIEKATELLWKVWWFCFYLLIVPSLIAVIGFYIFNFIIRDVYISSGFAVLSFMFSLLIFYEPFDKYRTNSFFRNKFNNPIARIHILYLVSILALIVTPVFVYITPEDYSFELLPLISYCVLYNIVYFYFVFQPIDYFDPSEKIFKHFGSFFKSVKKFYNAVIIVNFIFHIIFLSYTFDTKFSWLFALISDIIFYFVTFSSTRVVRKRILSKIQKDQPISSDLDNFKRKFSLSILSLVFILIIQMPFVVILVFTLSGQIFTNLEIFNAGLFSIALLIFYLKVRVYFSIYHQKKKQPKEVEILE
jgi:hypothetical protein